jgi:RES domain-containing protein
MVEYFRLIHRKHRDTPLHYGTHGARWNPRGVLVLYAASSVSLVMTEFLSLIGSAVLQSDWALITLGIRSDPPFVEVNSLPHDWNEMLYPISTQQFGKQWVSSKTSVCIKVPSVRIPILAYPKEHKLLINSHHPEFSREVVVLSVDDIQFNMGPTR